MTTARRICVVTGTRAEYGLLKWLIGDLQRDRSFELQLVVTGMHLAPEFGLTLRDIEADGFSPAALVDNLVAGDSGRAVAKSMGLGTIGLADAYDRLKPDLVVLLGDRFEILAAAQAALVMRIPIAHLCGGDTTEGAFDEAIRHSISKMASLHFPSNEESAQRLRLMGESDSRIHVVGSPGLDALRREPLLGRDELGRALGAPLSDRNILITYHPETLDSAAVGAPFGELLAALEALPDSVGLYFTYPNADPGGRALIAMIEAFVARRANARAYASLGQLRYLSLLAEADVVVGNSSSGLYEAPSFRIPTVNIGGRQAGRLKARSVIDCEPVRDAIGRALEVAFAMDCTDVENPYGDGYASQRIMQVLAATPDFQALLRKPFVMRQIVR